MPGVLIVFVLPFLLLVLIALTHDKIVTPSTYYFKKTNEKAEHSSPYLDDRLRRAADFRTRIAACSEAKRKKKHCMLLERKEGGNSKLISKQ